MSFRQAGSERVALAGLLIAAIAIVDWRVDAPLAFGFLSGKYRHGQPPPPYNQVFVPL